MRICFSDIEFFRRLTYIVIPENQDVIICLVRDYMDAHNMDIKLVDVSMVITHWYLPKFVEWLREKHFNVAFWHENADYGIDIADNCPTLIEYRLKRM